MSSVLWREAWWALGFPVYVVYITPRRVWTRIPTGCARIIQHNFLSDIWNKCGLDLSNANRNFDTLDKESLWSLALSWMEERTIKWSTWSNWFDYYSGKSKENSIHCYLTIKLAFGWQDGMVGTASRSRQVVSTLALLEQCCTLLWKEDPTTLAQSQSLCFIGAGRLRIGGVCSFVDGHGNVRGSSSASSFAPYWIGQWKFKGDGKHVLDLDELGDPHTI